MRSKILIIALLLAATTSLGASDLWIHVRVIESGHHPTNVEVNLPFGLIERLAPYLAELDHADHHCDNGIRIGHDDMDVEEFRDKWARLKQGEVLVEDDATLQLVDGARGQQLYVTERDGHKTGNVTIPADVIDALLSGGRDRLDFEAAVNALARHGEGELVTARHDDAIVRIWVDRNPDPTD